MNKKLSFGEPFLETRYLEAEESYAVTGSVILINIDDAEDILVNGEFHLPALQSMIVRNAVINVPAKALLVIGAEHIDLNDRECLTSLLASWKSNYQLTGNPAMKNVPFFKSPQEIIDGITINFCLVADPASPSGIHREHGKPVHELHVQISGNGAVDLMKSADPSSCYASIPLAPGSTHMHTWDNEGVYPWHRYRSVDRCLFLAVSIEA